MLLQLEEHLLVLLPDDGVRAAAAAPAVAHGCAREDIPGASSDMQSIMLDMYIRSVKRSVQLNIHCVTILDIY